MSDLSEFQRHARAMSTAQHKPDCPSLGPPSRPIWSAVYEGDDTCPSALRWDGMTPPPPSCPGCLTDADRALFAALADEVDAYLAAPPPEPDLFGDLTTQPTQPVTAGAEREAR